MLALPGSPRDGSADWLLAYKRWTQALYARNRIALESSLSDLTKLLGAWLGGMEAQEPDSLRKFWRQYLRIAMRTRGIALPVPSLGPGDNMEDADDGMRPEPIRTPVVREQSFAAIAAFTRDRDSAEDAAVCMEYKPNGRSVGSVTVRRRGSELEFELFSTVWEEKGRVETSGQAAELIAQLALFAIRATGRGALPQSWDEFLQRELPLREAAALVGDRRLFFGWFLRPADLRNMFRGPYGSPLVSRYFRMSHSENWRSPAMTVTTDGRVKLYA
jgi:hypothetical protein